MLMISSDEDDEPDQDVQQPEPASQPGGKGVSAKNALPLHLCCFKNI